jgi:hypothetical protein
MTGFGMARRGPSTAGQDRRPSNPLRNSYQRPGSIQGMASDLCYITPTLVVARPNVTGRLN